MTSGQIPEGDGVPVEFHTARVFLPKEGNRGRPTSTKRKGLSHRTHQRRSLQDLRYQKVLSLFLVLRFCLCLYLFLSVLPRSGRYRPFLSFSLLLCVSYYLSPRPLSLFTRSVVAESGISGTLPSFPAPSESVVESAQYRVASYSRPPGSRPRRKEGPRLYSLH